MRSIPEINSIIFNIYNNQFKKSMEKLNQKIIDHFADDKAWQSKMEEKFASQDEIHIQLLLKSSSVSNSIETLIKRFDEFKIEQKELSKRINIIELWQSENIGKLTVISIAIGIGISILTAWIIKQF